MWCFTIFHSVDANLNLCGLFCVSLPQKIEPFASSCTAAISYLQESISTLCNSGNLKTSKVRPGPPTHSHTNTPRLELWNMCFYCQTMAQCCPPLSTRVCFLVKSDFCWHPFLFGFVWNSGSVWGAGAAETSHEKATGWHLPKQAAARRRHRPGPHQERRSLWEWKLQVGWTLCPSKSILHLVVLEIGKQTNCTPSFFPVFI